MDKELKLEDFIVQIKDYGYFASISVGGGLFITFRKENWKKILEALLSDEV